MDTLDILSDFNTITRGLPVMFLVGKVYIKVEFDGIECGAVMFSGDEVYAAVITGTNKGIHKAKSPRHALAMLTSAGIETQFGADW